MALKKKTMAQERKEDALSRGYKAGLAGHSSTVNAFSRYENATQHKHWFQGWQEGRYEYLLSPGYKEDRPPHQNARRK